MRRVLPGYTTGCSREAYYPGIPQGVVGRVYTTLVCLPSVHPWVYHQHTLSAVYSRVHTRSNNDAQRGAPGLIPENNNEERRDEAQTAPLPLKKERRVLTRLLALLREKDVKDRMWQGSSLLYSLWLGSSAQCWSSVAHLIVED